MIRKVETSDLAAILELEGVSFPTPWTLEMYLAEMTREGALFLAAREMEATVAYLCAFTVLDEGHLMKIAVAPEHRRRGLGRRLMDAMFREFRARGVAEVWLEVRDRNFAGRAFYRALEFEEIGRRRKYYSDTGEDALVMMKKLEINKFP